MSKRTLKNRFLVLLTEKERREARRIKLGELVKEIGVSLPTIHNWINNEVGKYEGPIVGNICDYFGCDVADLLYLDYIEDTKSNQK